MREQPADTFTHTTYVRLSAGSHQHVILWAAVCEIICDMETRTHSLTEPVISLWKHLRKNKERVKQGWILQFKTLCLCQVVLLAELYVFSPAGFQVIDVLLLVDVFKLQAILV